MPILHVEKSKSILFVKWSISYRYSAIDDEFFYKDNTLILFRDA